MVAVKKREEVKDIRSELVSIIQDLQKIPLFTKDLLITAGQDKKSIEKHPSYLKIKKITDQILTEVTSGKPVKEKLFKELFEICTFVNATAVRNYKGKLPANTQLPSFGALTAAIIRVSQKIKTLNL